MKKQTKAFLQTILHTSKEKTRLQSPFLTLNTNPNAEVPIILPFLFESLL